MDRKQFAVLVAALKTYYSKEDKLIPNKQAMELWYGQLHDIPFEVAEAALNKWVATNKWSPSIAELREEARNIQQGDIPDWGDGWEKVLTAIRRYGSYNVPAAMESLDDITRRCVERLGFRELCMSEDISIDRANFRMLYEQLSERKRKEGQLPPALSALIGDIQSGKMLSSDRPLRLGGEYE